MLLQRTGRAVPEGKASKTMHRNWPGGGGNSHGFCKEKETLQIPGGDWETTVEVKNAPPEGNRGLCPFQAAVGKDENPECGRDKLSKPAQS